MTVKEVFNKVEFIGAKDALKLAAALAAAVRALPGLEAAADPAAMRAEALDRFGEEKNYAQLLAIYRRMLAGDEGADS